MCFLGFRLREYIWISGRHYAIAAVASIQPDQKTLFDVDSLPLNSFLPVFFEAKFVVTNEHQLVLESIDSNHEELSLMRPAAEFAFTGRLLLSDDGGIADARFECGRLIDLIDNDTLRRQDVEALLGRSGAASEPYVLLKQDERALRQKEPTQPLHVLNLVRQSIYIKSRKVLVTNRGFCFVFKIIDDVAQVMTNLSH